MDGRVWIEVAGSQNAKYLRTLGLKKGAIHRRGLTWFKLTWDDVSDDRLSPKRLTIRYRAILSALSREHDLPTVDRIAEVIWKRQSLVEMLERGASLQAGN